MDRKEISSKLQQLKLFTIHGMTTMCVLMTAHCGLKFFGIDSYILHLLFWAYVMIMGLLLSRIFNLCWVHKLSVLYTMSVIFYTMIERRFITSEALAMNIKGAMFVIGLIVIGLNAWKMKQRNC